ncbi:MAG: hypothetical protein WCE40_04585 [Polyangia bacterium]
MGYQTHAQVVVMAVSQATTRGILALVCADRWTLNRYGAPLRRLIADKYHVQSYVDLHQASPFESEVSAYPAIFSIGRQSTGPVMVARMATGAPAECEALRAAIHGGHRNGAGAVEFCPTWFEGDAPWIVTSPEQSETHAHLRSSKTSGAGGTDRYGKRGLAYSERAE